MRPKLFLIGNLLLLLLVVIIIFEKVYSHRLPSDQQILIAYAEICLVLVLILFYGFSIFYKYLKKP